MLKIVIQDKGVALVNENPATGAALAFHYAADNVLLLAESEILGILKDLVAEKTEMRDGKPVKLATTLELLNKKFKATEGVYFEITKKEFGGV